MPDVLGFRKRHRPASYTCGVCNWDGAACRSSLRRHLASNCVVKPRARSRVAQDISNENLPDKLMPSNPGHSAEPDDLSSDPPLLSLGSDSPVGQDANGTSEDVPLRALEEQLLQQLQQAQLLDAPAWTVPCNKKACFLGETLTVPAPAAAATAAENNGATAPPGRARRAAAEPSGSGGDLLASVHGEAEGSNMNPEVQQKRKKRSRSTPVAEMVSNDSDEQEFKASDSEELSVEEAVAKVAQEAAARKSSRAVEPSAKAAKVVAGLRRSKVIKSAK